MIFLFNVFLHQSLITPYLFIVLLSYQASFATLIFIVVTWVVTFIMTGLHTDYVPLVSDNQSQVVGTVLFNYAFVITVPSWVNDLVSQEKLNFFTA